MSCADCDESMDLCKECRKPICSLHRIGTGALSEGYACSLACSLREAGFIPRPPESLPQRVGWVPILCGAFIVIWCLLAIILK